MAAFALNDSYVYWTDGSSQVQRVAESGGPVQTIAPGQSKPYGLAVDATFVYWSNQLGGAILRAPKDGSGTAQVLATATQPGDIAIYQGNLYWIDQGPNVWTVPTAGVDGGSGTMAAASVTSSPGNVTLIAGASDLYVLNTIKGGGTPESQGLYSVFRGLLQSFDATEDPGDPGVAVDATSVYFNWGINGSPQTCSVGRLDSATGARDGCILYGGNPLAANGCGLFMGAGLSLGRAGFTYSASVLSHDADFGAIDGAFFYFHSSDDNAIGKLPMP